MAGPDCPRGRIHLPLLGSSSSGRIGGIGALASLALALLLLLGPAEARAQATSGLTYETEQVSVKNGFDEAGTFSFETPCPAGTVALGGGWSANNLINSVVGATEVAPASKAANSWRVAGVNVTPGSGSTDVHGYVSCAPASAFPSGALTYPSPETIELKPWPEKPRSGEVRVTCSAGQVPIAGGFKVQDESLDLGVAGSYPLYLDNNTTGQWVVNGKNSNIIPWEIESWDMTAAATCVDASIAFGVIGLHVETNTQEVDDPKWVTASCGAGQPISGGFTAQNGKGTKFDYTGTINAMRFTTSERDGYEINYNSGTEYHHDFTTITICGDVVPSVATLGKADFDDACRASLPESSGVQAVPGKHATDWKCASDNGPAVPVPGNAGVWACEGVHDPVRPTATYLRRSDPLSWVCYEGFRQRQLSVADFEGRAKGVGSKGRRAKVRIEGRARLNRPVGNLNRAVVTIGGTLHEATAGGDLLEKRKGDEVHPVTLVAPRGPSVSTSGARRRKIVLKGGAKPRFKVKLRRSKSGRSLRFKLRARRGSIESPRLCDSGPDATTHLTTRLGIETPGSRPVEVLAGSYWSCGGKRMQTTEPALPLG
jgi:hypothetical protein